MMKLVLLHQVNLFLGEPTFAKLEMQLKKFDLMFFFQIFCIDTWARMLFPISNNRYMDLYRNK